MNESQTRLLIQRELDGNLSQEEETRLRRVLMVSDSAVSFRANLSQVVAAAKDLELPDDVRPGDSSRLAVEIIENLPVVKGSFWDPLFDIFSGRKSAKTDLRSTRSVASRSQTAPAARVVGSGNNAAGVSGKGTGQNNSAPNHTAIGASGTRSMIDPAVLAPQEAAKEGEKNKTPYGLPAVDQYLTGTHSAVGGLAKKLRKDFGNTQSENVGKTLADAIREKVHESYTSAHDDDGHTAGLSSSQSQALSHDAIPDFVANQDEAQRGQAHTEHHSDVAKVEIQAPTPSPNFDPSLVLPVATTSPHIVQANLSMQNTASKINLGTSMVLTIAAPVSGGPQSPQTSPNPQTSGHKGHDFAAEELEWKSGTYPTVPPPVKPWAETQAETGPLAPFPINASPSIAKLNLKGTAEIMKQLAADSRSAWVPPQTPENPAPPADPWAPPPAPSPQPIHNPWAPAAVQSPIPFSSDSWVQHPVATNQWAPPSPPVPFVPIPFAPEPTAPTPIAPTPITQIPIISTPKVPETSGEVVGYAPTIVPVTRNTLPIEAIGERINLLFSEPTDAKPPTVVSQPVKDMESVHQENAAMENDVKACLSSIGRLADLRYATNNPGHIKDLGRFLLTDDTIESIGNCIGKGLGHSHARVVTLEAAQQLAVALEPVLNTRGVAGYMVCGYDGLPISSNLPADVDMELLGGCALVTFMNSHSIMKVMGHTKINQLICHTPGGCMLLADFGKGILVTVTNDRDAAMLANLTETIASVSAE